MPNQADQREFPDSTGEYRLLSDPEEILATWGEEIDQAGEGEKVWLRTMHCRESEAMRFLGPKLIEAAGRNADVRIIYDPISYFESSGLPSYARHFPIPGRGEIANEYERNKALVAKLAHGGVQMDHSRPETLGRQLVPYTGADHIKGVRIRDRFWFGDKNLEDKSFSEMKGFVIEIPNQEIIDKLTAIIGSTSSPATDQLIEIASDPATTIIWDAGIPGQSVILDTAQKDVIGKESEFIGTATQFYPEGRYYRALKEARERGSTVESITSSPGYFGISPYALVNDLAGKGIRWDGLSLPEAFLKEARERFRAQDAGSTGDFRMLFAPKGIHAKYVVTPTEVEFGTNNHSEAGVRAGTAELAIHSTNPAIVQPVLEYHQSLYQSLRTS